MSGPQRLEPILDAAGNRWDPGGLGRDEAISALAARQSGRVSAWQLRGLGVNDAAVRRRVTAARLHRVSAGVLAVGHPGETEDGRLIRGVLAYRPPAILSHRSAAARRRLVRHSPRLVDVIAATGTRRPGTRLHRVPILEHDIETAGGLRIARVGRTLADLAGVVSPLSLERAVHEAQVLGLLSRHEIGRAARTSAGRPGGGRLRDLLAEVDPDVRLRSHLERRFLAGLRAEGLPLPQMNALVAFGTRCYEIDAAWLSMRVAVELDSGFHDTAIARRADAERDRALAAAGWRTLRLRERDLHERPLTRVLTGPDDRFLLDPAGR